MLSLLGEYDVSGFQCGRCDKVADCHILLLGSFYDLRGLFF